jgi:hypothetical protein
MISLKEGQKFGMLTVIEEAERKTLPCKQKIRQILCKCDCGKEKTILLLHLIRGRTISCGCVSKVKNGESKSILHKRWKAMHERTFEGAINSNCYFEKGVKVCDEWKDYFVFKEWALNNGYKESLTIDRIDNSKGYYPDNCRYVTPTENANNKSTNRYVTYKGEVIAISLLLRRLNKLDNYGTIISRLQRGWDAEKAIDTPSRKGNYKNLKNAVK